MVRKGDPEAPASPAAAADWRMLPRGRLHFGLQLLIWFGFLFAYKLARGIADRDPALAFANGLRILDFERRITHRMVELTLQRLADSSHWLLTAAAWTYWNSEFTVVGLALLWVYLRRHEQFARLRNSVLLANLLGLVGFVLEPTAPPRMFPRFGFTDTLDSIGGLNHGSGLVQLAANPYAAMPSLHSADALILAVVLFATCRRIWTKALWLLWPAWVWFCVIATANHYLLDVLAGIGVALLSLVSIAVTPQLTIRRSQNQITSGGIRAAARPQKSASSTFVLLAPHDHARDQHSQAGDAENDREARLRWNRDVLTVNRDRDRGAPIGTEERARRARNQPPAHSPIGMPSADHHRV